MQPHVHITGSKDTNNDMLTKNSNVWSHGGRLDTKGQVRVKGVGGSFSVPAKVSPAGGGVSAWRDSRSSEVWQSVSGYSCRSAMITLHSHSTALIYSGPTQESYKVCITRRHTHKHRDQQTRQISTPNIHLKLPRIQIYPSLFSQTFCRSKLKHNSRVWPSSEVCVAPVVLTWL